jgi:hypothetical protein
MSRVTTTCAECGTPGTVDVRVFDPDRDVPLCDRCEAAGTARLLVHHVLGSPDAPICHLWLEQKPEGDPGADLFPAPSLN